MGFSLENPRKAKTPAKKKIRKTSFAKEPLFLNDFIFNFILLRYDMNMLMIRKIVFFEQSIAFTGH